MVTTTETYSDRTEAIERVIVASIEGGGEVPDARAEYDVDAIADHVVDDEGTTLIDTRGSRWVCTVDVDDFWAVVAEHERPAPVPVEEWDERLRDLAERRSEARAAAEASSAALADVVEAAADAGVSVWRIARVTGVSRTTITRWARGER